VNTEDAKVSEYLRKFTFLLRPEIEEFEARHAANPGAREAHRALAREVTRLVHGDAALVAAIKASEILFGGTLEGITEAIFNDVVGEVPTRDLERSRLEAAGSPLTDLLVHSGLSPSKGQARKDIEGGGIYLNNVRVGEIGRAVTAADLLFGKHLLLRKGKRTYAVLSAK
jgi:tyrosyl-tRNA synthetase